MRKALAIIGVVAILVCQTPFVYAATFTFGSVVLYNNNTTNFQAISTIDSTHVIAAFSDNGIGKAAIGTVNGSSISFASSATFAAASTTHLDVAVLDSTHAVIVFQTGTIAKVVAASISGDSITYGTAAEISTNIATSGASPRVIISKLDSTHFVITYSKDTAGARDQRLVAGEVSGTSITLGSSTSIHNANRAAYNALTQLDSTRFVVTHTTSTGVAYAIVGTVTGTSIGTGSKV